MTNDDDGEVIIYRGCAKPGDTNFADVVAMDSEIVDYLAQPKTVSFSDRQLEQVLAAARIIPVGQRSDWLRALAGVLGAEPTDDELREALG